MSHNHNHCDGNSQAFFFGFRFQISTEQSDYVSKKVYTVTSVLISQFTWMWDGIEYLVRESGVEKQMINIDINISLEPIDITYRLNLLPKTALLSSFTWS